VLIIIVVYPGKLLYTISMINKLLYIALLASVATPGWCGDSFSGELSGPGDTEEFEIVADYSPYEIEFSTPLGTYFLVTVYDENHNEIGDFNLIDGNIINLTGGGSFYLRVHSAKGGGAWYANEINNPDEYHGHLDSTGENEEFGIYLFTSPVYFFFDSPENAIFYTTVFGENHNTLGEYDLRSENRVKLTGGGQFYIEVRSEDGAGPWTAYWLDAGVQVFDNIKSGILSGEGDSNTFPLYAEDDPTNVRFSYPKDADFHVKVYGRDNNELGNYNLRAGNEISLIGGGQFYVEVLSEEDGGQWTASW